MQPPQRENVVSSVSELWGLCQLSRRHKGGLLTHRKCNCPDWRKAPKALAELGNFDKWSEEEELSSLLLGIALGISTFGCPSR